MLISEFVAGDVVRVPFPYSDFSSLQRRPALVIARPDAGTGPALLWVLMITSAANRGWPGDVAINGHAEAGLPVPSMVRTAKIATIEAGRAQAVGRVTGQTLAVVRDVVRERFG